MKILHKMPNTIERDALINELSNHNVEAYSPETLEMSNISYGGFSAEENKYSVFVQEEDLEKAKQILENFLKK